MKMKRALKAGAAVLALSSLTGLAMADCNFIDGTSTMVRTMPLLGGNITVGRDVPLGTEVYRQTFSPSTTVNISCSAGLYNIETRRGLPVLPLPLSSWAGTPWGGHVYQSGVPGIGVAIWYSGTPLPFTGNGTNCGGGTASCNYYIRPTMAFDLSLIKIGDVSPGTIQGSQLPTVDQKWVASNTVELSRVNFSGSMNVVSRTCDTPDVAVAMGTHMTHEFSGLNSSTPWKDFVIKLNNCPAFHGTQRGGGPRWGSDGTVTPRTPNANVLMLRLDATRPAINPSLGILSLNPSAPGDAVAATGVGVQVADSHGGALPLATLRPSGITPSATEGKSYQIDLKARYIQTAGSVTAGPANASAVFTINYQ
ncbi:fimbrial protein [Pseudomonas chlororaphis]|uniref:Type 1 fimbrial protein n=1 Tax=Pseudomonas chlororaphis subsp. aurantiaca TaxID=86192 RepID=A0AAJ0ZI22_9PSED|nr:fimbrial protein [Pseudomonas chlororaphis]MBU4632848.1 type 1 fimbrial protein [Pseudomonas chlororaphis subsp. aurantiaca]